MNNDLYKEITVVILLYEEKLSLINRCLEYKKLDKNKLI